ncbi:molybdopterin-synthase adenylyltransferase MoeB [Inmirania thermothiophila]|uniref:Molybdopterin-synthase adenylyltransferase n=1 Tax=Inmirania thermothiophila TaxID=1750597 RepID=A0A3N1Y7F6_9GAMM|nr:molybdopterin-synthase adenylyltransferase MoeB [Inmirania thermothiophila]ROR34759.1 molybdopterin/thiamine biosynthesis adenylyltransferase [Inmirania thermothiophila]
MSSVTVRIPTPLRGYTGGADEVSARGGTVGEVLADLGEHHPGILAALLDEAGGLRSFVNLFVDGERVRDLAAPVRDGAVLAIVPAVAGGTGGGRIAERRLAELRARIPEVTPREALALVERQGAVLVDVREPDEVAQGSPAGAARLGRGYLELRIEEVAPDPDRPVLTLCEGGIRSLFAAEDLMRLGYRDVRSVAGGFTRWKSEGLPFEIPPVLDAAARERYARHLLMPEVGEAGQLRLLGGRVLLVGAGGLGSPAAFYLAAAGVGTLGIVDHDVVDRSNLQRQILHADDRVGMPKVASAAEALTALNPSVQVVPHPVRLTSDNVEEILSGYDVVVDGSDNFPTRYLVNDACVRLGIPDVHGAVYRFEGQVTVFWPRRPEGRGPCYRCLYPEPPPPQFAPSCAEAGVLGVLPGVIGLLQAVEAIKILLGLGDPLVGRMLHYDALRARFTELRLAPDRACRYCAEGAPFPGYVDYEHFCAAADG